MHLSLLHGGYCVPGPGGEGRACSFSPPPKRKGREEVKGGLESHGSDTVEEYPWKEVFLFRVLERQTPAGRGFRFWIESLSSEAIPQRL